MKSIIPYTKECNFSGKVAEITSISLEHETKIENGELSGNFLVSGDYKSHEISINKEPFEFNLPFAVELSEEVDRTSVDFEITNFTYDLLNDNTIKVNIEFAVEAQEVMHDEIDERTPDIFEEIDEVYDDPFEQLMQETDEEIRETYVVEELAEENVEIKEDLALEVDIKEEERNVNEIAESTIVDAIKKDEDSYITYNIHIVKEHETIESITGLHEIDIDILAEYNDITNINIGDKIVVPAKDIDE